VGCFALYGAVYVGFGASEPERDRVRTLLRLPAGGTAAATPRVVAPREPVERMVTDIAVCICTFHRPGGLARLLDALPAAVPVGEVAGVGDVRVRIVVVDNEVAERNEAIVAAAADRLPWPVTYVPEPTRGISYARNTAVRHALPDADFVAFVDDDEVPEPGWLTALLQTQRSTGADVVMGPQDTVYDDEPPRWVRRGGFFRAREFAEAEPLHWATTANVLISADLFAIADPPFSERLALAGGEDTHFFRRAHLSGARIVWTGTARVREHVPSNRTTARWLVQREYRRGNTLGICLVDLEDSASRRFKRVVRAALSVARGAALATTAVVSGRAGLVRGAQAVGFGVGLVTGMGGHVYDEYADDSRYEMPSAEPVG
jgi:GT2 family glycosyltransferase